MFFNNPFSRKTVLEKIMEENVYGVTLSQLMKSVLKRWWIIALATVVCAVMLFVYTDFFVTPMYSTSAKLGVNSDEMSIYQDFLSGQAMSKDYAEIVISNVTLARAAKMLNEYDFEENGGVPYREEYTASVLSKMISIETVDSSRFFDIVIVSEYPQETKIVADHIIEAFCARLRDENIIRGGEGRVLNQPTVPQSPSSPNIVTNTLIGALAGFALSFGCLLVAGLMKDDLDSEEWLIAHYSEKVPLLAVIPDARASARSYKYSRYSYNYGYAPKDN